jgi:hypothetical protein
MPNTSVRPPYRDIDLSVTVIVPWHRNVRANAPRYSVVILVVTDRIQNIPAPIAVLVIVRTPNSNVCFSVAVVVSNGRNVTL